MTGPLQSTADEATCAWVTAAIPEGYELTIDGLTWCPEKGKSERIAGPVWVSAFTEDKGTGVHGIIIGWIDRRGRVQEGAWRADTLHSLGRALA